MVLGQIQNLVRRISHGTHIEPARESLRMFRRESRTPMFLPDRSIPVPRVRAKCELAASGQSHAKKPCRAASMTICTRSSSSVPIRSTGRRHSNCGLGMFNQYSGSSTTVLGLFDKFFHLDDDVDASRNMGISIKAIADRRCRRKPRPRRRPDTTQCQEMRPSIDKLRRVEAAPDRGMNALGSCFPAERDRRPRLIFFPLRSTVTRTRDGGRVLVPRDDFSSHCDGRMTWRIVNVRVALVCGRRVRDQLAANSGGRRPRQPSIEAGSANPSGTWSVSRRDTSRACCSASA